MKVLIYRKCSTCMKALKWLDEHSISYEERAIKEENPTYEELKEWYTKSGLPLKKFFNTRKAFCTFPFTVSQKTGWKKGCLSQEKLQRTGTITVHWNISLQSMK